MLVALGSWRGSPGVTTSALALAEAWPDGRRVYVAECDPRGGTLVARFLLPGTRRLVALAGDARNNGDLALLEKHAMITKSGVRCLTGPEDGAQLRAALSTLLVPGGVLENAADETETVLIADCGRLESDVPQISVLLLMADLLVIVAKPSQEQALCLTGVREQLAGLHPNCGLLLVGSGSPSDEIEHLLKLPVLGQLPHIPSGSAARLVERARCGFGPSRFRRSARDAAAAIASAAERDVRKTEAVK